MVRAVRPLGSLSMARGCAQIDSRFDTVKIGSAGRVEVHRARLLAITGVRKTFPHGLDPMRTLYASEGIVSKRRDRPVSGQGSKDWIKLKMERVMERSFT
jgi:hypothetical protein